MTRLANWQRLFDEEYERRSKTRLQWGLHDCCLGPSALIAAMTGTNPAAPVMGYESFAEARQIAFQYGGFREMIQTLANQAGFAPVASERAQRGDLVLVRLAGQYERAANESFTEGLCIGVIDLSGRRVIMTGVVGWIEAGRNMTVEAWRV